MTVEKRNAWNGLIDLINSLAANCSGVEPLPSVGLKHVWTKRDVRLVHEKLTEVCGTPAWNPIADRLKKATLTEINNAISTCGGCGGSPQSLYRWMLVAGCNEGDAGHWAMVADGTFVPGETDFGGVGTYQTISQEIAAYCADPGNSWCCARIMIQKL